MTSCENAGNPVLCTRGCGFYGSPSTNNLCSLCYKVFLEEEKAKNVAVLCNQMSSVTLDDHSEGTSHENVDSTMKIKKRCMICKKKVGLIEFNCRCGGMFCRVHRYPEEHACTYDFKFIGRLALAKENPLCKANKLENRI